MIIKKIHQTWKTNNIPYDIFPKEWIESWLKYHPDWEYHLWTDEDNRDFVKTNYPQFLNMYDSLNSNIKRADVIRYFRLHKDGGLYVDLDCVAFKSMVEVIDGKDLLFGAEPEVKWEKHNKGNCILSNALMYSTPGHPFWEVLYNELKKTNLNKHVISSTGPKLLTRAYTQYLKNNKPGFILDSNMFIWCRNRKEKDVKKMYFMDNKIIDNRTYAAHISQITWVGSNGKEKVTEVSKPTKVANKSLKVIHKPPKVDPKPIKTSNRLNSLLKKMYKNSKRVF